VRKLRFAHAQKGKTMPIQGARGRNRTPASKEATETENTPRVVPSTGTTALAAAATDAADSALEPKIQIPGPKKVEPVFVPPTAEEPTDASEFTQRNSVMGAVVDTLKSQAEAERLQKAQAKADQDACYSRAIDLSSVLSHSSNSTRSYVVVNLTYRKRVSSSKVRYKTMQVVVLGYGTLQRLAGICDGILPLGRISNTTLVLFNVSKRKDRKVANRIMDMLANPINQSPVGLHNDVPLIADAVDILTIAVYDDEDNHTVWPFEEFKNVKGSMSVSPILDGNSDPDEDYE